MAETGSLLPAEVDLEATIGADCSWTFTLYQDVAQTTAFDLTGYTVTMTIGGLFTLTSGSGLTITAGSGQIVATLTHVQTATVVPNPPNAPVHWTLKLSSGSGTVTYPMSGDMSFVSP